MITFEINVLCDSRPQCAYALAYTHLAEAPDVQAALAAARTEGWLERDGKVYCPLCAERLERSKYPPHTPNADLMHSDHNAFPRGRWI
jgi:hypothetical protein